MVRRRARTAAAGDGAETGQEMATTEPIRIPVAVRRESLVSGSDSRREIPVDPAHRKTWQRTTRERVRVPGNRRGRPAPSSGYGGGVARRDRELPACATRGASYATGARAETASTR